MIKFKKALVTNVLADGGVIAIDKTGNIGISFNSEGMYRAFTDQNGKPVIKIYED